MAITSAQLQASIEKFLPRSLNTSRDSDSGQLDESSIAERALLIANISLLLDIESPFHPLSIAVQAFAEDLQSIIEFFTELTGDDLLLSLRDESPGYITDLSKLESARTSLLSAASSAGVDDTFSDTYIDDFTSDVEDFVSENIVSNVTNRNRVVIRDESKALYATLEPLWLGALAKKTALISQVGTFMDLDLKTKVVSEIAVAIKEQLDETIADLEDANASEQAALAEDILCDLAAARAVVRIIQNAPTMESDTVGTPAVIPVIGEEGSTPDDYLQRQGKAYVEPVDVVDLPSGARYGTAGKLSITPLYAGATGVAVDDGDGDYSTPDLRDLGATFVADGVEAGDYLFLVRDGTTHRITEVTDEKNLILTPEIPNDITSDRRYVITDAPLGLYFQDDSESFWTQFTDGASGSNVLISGSGGEFEEDTRLTGTNGANSKDYSTAGDGESQPYRGSGTDGQPHGEYDITSGDVGNGSISLVMETQADGVLTNPVSGQLNSALATFQTNNVQPGDWLYIDDGAEAGNTYQVATVPLETRITIVGTFGSTYSGATYRVFSSSIFYQASGPFAASDVGKYLAFRNWVASPIVWEGPVEITGYIDANRVRIDADLCLGVYADGFTHTGIGFCVTTTQYGDVFYSSTLDAFNNLIAVGDELTISGYTTTESEDLNDTWEITAILDANRVRIDIDPPFGSPTTAMTNQEDLTWYVQRGDVDASKLFYAPDGEFLTTQVADGDKLYIDDGTGADVGSSFTVDDVLSQTTLLVTVAFSDNETDLEWHISPSTTDFMRDPDVIMPTGILGDGLAFELTITTSSPVGQAGDYALDEDEVGTYTLTTTDVLANADLYTYSSWRVKPSDDKTYLFTQSDLDFADYDGGGSSLGATASMDGRYDRTYLVVDGYDSVEVLYIIKDDPYDTESEADTLRFSDRYAVDAGPLDWEVWVGLTTDVFTSATAQFVTNSAAVGDLIRIDPGGPGESDHYITEVVDEGEVKISPEINAGQTGLTFVMFNSVRPGMELVTGGRRTVIADIIGESILQLEKTLPGTYGKDAFWAVVRPETDINTARITDNDAAFIAAGGFGTADEGVGELADWVAGSTVHVMGRRQFKATPVGCHDYDGDDVAETLILDTGIPLWEGRVSYKILDFEEYKTTTFIPGDDLESNPIDVSDFQAGDYLTVWGQSDVYVIQAVDAGEGSVTVEPRIAGNLSDQVFAICRNGAQAYGRYLLLEHLLDDLSMTATLEQLKLHLAEVVADFGGTLQEAVIPNTLTDPPDYAGEKITGEASFTSDNDDDTTTPTITLTTNRPTIKAGDYIVMDLSDPADDVAESYSYVRSVDHSDLSQSVLTLWHEFEEGTTIQGYIIYRNSVSFVLDEVYSASGLYGQVEAIKDVADAFEVPANSNTDSIIEVFRDVGMDKAIDVLKSGDLSTLSDMDASDTSYSAAASEAVNELGKTTEAAGTSSGTSSYSSNVAGENVVSGTESSGSTGAAFSYTVPEDTEVRIALADLAEWLASEVKTEESTQFSLEDALARAIFELNGEHETGFITDDDDLLPWIVMTGSKRTRLVELMESALAALGYMEDHPDEFETVETT